MSKIGQKIKTESSGHTEEQDNKDDNDKKVKWGHISVMCYLEILWEQYDKAKNSVIPKRIIFCNAAKEMEKNGFTFTLDEVRKKYSNLSETYRRIKSKVASSGEKSDWPYYEIMKEIRRKERGCRMQHGSAFYPSAIKRKASLITTDSPNISNIKTEFEPPLKKDIITWSNNLSSPAGGVAIETAEDCLSFSNQWQSRRYSLEEYKMQLIETLFKNLKQQRQDAEEDTNVTLQMYNIKNKHLKQIITEMTRLKLEVKKELSSLSESVNDLISALRSSSERHPF